jgi:SAM-dependent methyltransferase
LIDPTATTGDADPVKTAMKAFYADEARPLTTEAWLARGGTARVPESRASHYFIDRKVETAVALAGLGADARVLEVGSSFGHMTFLLARRFREVVAVDLSAESVALAARRARHYGVANVRFAEADAERLEAFPDRSFDGVFSFSTLRFCPQPTRALAEIHRVLRPGGRAVVDVPNRRCPWYGPVKGTLGIDPHIHDRLYAREEIAAMMAASGLEDVVTRTILFTTKRAPAALVPLCRILDGVLERTPGARELAGIVMAAGTRSGAR